MLKIIIFAVTVVLLVINLVLKKRNKKRIVAIIMMGIVLFTLSDSVTVVPTGYSGVRSTFGQ